MVTRPGRCSWWVAVPAVLVFGTSCTLTHLERNAPGRIDLLTPPADITQEAIEEPEDPGERVFILSPGVLAGIGTAWQTSQARLFGDLTFETSFVLGASPRSAPLDNLFGTLPAEALALNLGMVFVEQHGRDADLVTGPIYAEVEYRETLLGFGLGYRVDPRTPARHGVQGLLFAGPLYARIVHNWAYDTQVTFGLVMKARFAWLWSR